MCRMIVPIVLRRRLLLGMTLTVTALAVLAGSWYMKYHAAEQTAGNALESLERGIDVPRLRSAITRLERNRRFDEEVHLLRAACALRTAQSAEALKHLQEVEPGGKLRLPRLIVAGEFLYRTGHLADAERVFRKVAAERPQAMIPHRWLATILHEIGAMRAALLELEQVARLQPDDFFAYRLMGLVYSEDFSRHKEAVENYRRALERNPPPEQAELIRRECTQCLVSLNDYSGALEMLASCREDARVLALRAECRWSLTEPDEARRLLDLALGLDPHDRNALMLSARIAMDEGDPRRAVVSLQTLLADDPHDYDARYQLSRAFRRAGDRQAAAAAVEQMQESKALRERLGGLYERAMARAHDAEVRDEIAALCDALGKRELAGI